MGYAASELRENVARVRERIAQAARAAGRNPADILLCAACKTQSSQTVALASALEIDAFGENRAQELDMHHRAGAYGRKPCHFIGHLQRNKTPLVVGRAALIESVDSLRLLHAVAEEAVRRQIVQPVLLEINIAREPSKTGLSPGELEPALEAAARLSGVQVRGLMAIPPKVQTEGQNRRYFAAMMQLFVDTRQKKYDNVNMHFLSLGMSLDYMDAIAEGANIVRIGTAIFGRRDPEQ